LRFQTKSKIAKWVSTLAAKRVLLASNRDITVKPFLYGEDYYIHTIVSELERCGVPVNFAIFSGKKMESLGRDAAIDIEKIVDEHTVVILHNVSPFRVCKVKIKKRMKVVMPVYFVWNKLLLAYTNLRGSLGLSFWQPIVDEYLVATPSVAERLRKLGIVRKISILPPEYTCTHCSHIDNSRKRAKLKTQLPRIVEMVYIGSMIPKRFPLPKITDTLNRHSQREYKLRIYTTSQVNNGTYQKGNVEIRIIRRRLSDGEKCKILRESHVFIAPAKGTTMEPSISVLEAEYHGNIIARF
jgi:hypothetical protein